MNRKKIKKKHKKKGGNKKELLKKILGIIQIINAILIIKEFIEWIRELFKQLIS